MPQVEGTASKTFQAGHEGSIPFARSNQKAQVRTSSFADVVGAGITEPRRTTLATGASYPGLRRRRVFRRSIQTPSCVTYDVLRYTALVTIAISLRLDDETQRALGQLEAAGLSRSEAIRRAIIDSASRLQRRKALAQEAAALEADEADRREMLEVAAVMESMRAAG